MIDVPSAQRTRRFFLGRLAECVALRLVASHPVFAGEPRRSGLENFPPPPPPCPPRLAGLLGRYGGPSGPLVRENDGRLEVLLDADGPRPLDAVADDRFRFAGARTLAFSRDESGEARAVALDRVPLSRQTTGAEQEAFRITPREPLAELRRRARSDSPPAERGPFRAVDLVDVASLDATIHLDIRYATALNFLGAPVYTAARAFLQRPAAAGVLAAHRALAARGFGLLIHDAYRPWWVTKVFWDATPPDQREFVADPARGSRHNRGCAVDLTLYRLEDGRRVEMPGGYDEFSERSYPAYPGGTSRQRWHRDLLRRAMEEQGFTVFESEWWHFDSGGWREYPILNVPFDTIGP